MLLPNAAVASMHEPTTMDNLDEIVTMAQSHSEGVPTPYADISNPGKRLDAGSGAPLFLINEAKELRNEWLDEKRELIDKMRPRP